MSTLPQFVPDDSQAITQELITAYEAMTGKTLYPGQIERLLIDLIAYRETLVRTAINDTGRQNLVAFSRAPMLDYLGELVGVARLPAQSARALIRETNDPFALSETGSGGINIIDLANIDSCCFIETQDLGRCDENGFFEVLGRFDNSMARGCNLLVV